MSGRYWMATVPERDWTPPTNLHEDTACIMGQLEVGSNTGYRHWQVLVAMKRTFRMKAVKNLIFGCPSAHLILTKSEKARDYVHKEDTYVEGTRFKLGDYAVRRNVDTDWALIRKQAQEGSFKDIPDDIFVRHYGNIKRIAADNVQPSDRFNVRVFVLWGETATGKTYRAWKLAGRGAYAKDPCTKWWCGYTGQDAVIIDEFGGDINIRHLLRWLDGYPCLVEPKGGYVPLKATTFILTSNEPPESWYPNLPPRSMAAFLRRLNIFEVTSQDQVIEFSDSDILQNRQ